MRKVVGTAIILAAMTAGSAQAACWTPSEAAAAKVRDLDTMLMVSTLRCRAQAPEMVAKYNALVERHRAPLTEMNARIRAHFAVGVTPRAADAAYDTYVTRMANRYGAGVGDLSCQSLMAITDDAAIEIADIDGLVAVAERAEVSPDLSEGTCPAPAAVVAVVAAPVVTVAIETAPPAAISVTLAGLQH